MDHRHHGLRQALNGGIGGKALNPARRHLLMVHGFAFLEIGAGAKGRAVAHDQRHVHAGVRRNRLHDLHQLRAHLRTERITAIGPVQCHRGNTVPHLKQNRVISRGHACS
ncbi:hypothetical protein D3C87_1693290 [compost metagenome]